MTTVMFVALTSISYLKMFSVLKHNESFSLSNLHIIVSVSKKENL